MPAKLEVAVLIGSLREGSLTRKVVRQLRAFDGPLELSEVAIGDLPLYNEDLENGSSTPEEWIQFRSAIKSADGLLFATPEYNRSVPGVLKNAIDVGSRPYGDNAFDGKPGAVISVSPGALGAFGANHHLRQSLVFLNVPTMQQPEAYVGGAAEMFDEAGNVKDQGTSEFLESFTNAFANWISTHLSA